MGFQLGAAADPFRPAHPPRRQGSGARRRYVARRGLPAHRPVARVEQGEPHLSDPRPPRSEEHTSELQSLMRISYAVFCLKKKNNNKRIFTPITTNNNNYHT